jgi:hypothetical protein
MKITFSDQVIKTFSGVQVVKRTTITLSKQGNVTAMTTKIIAMPSEKLAKVLISEGKRVVETIMSSRVVKEIP